MSLPFKVTVEDGHVAAVQACQSVLPLGGTNGKCEKQKVWLSESKSAQGKDMGSRAGSSDPSKHVSHPSESQQISLQSSVVSGPMPPSGWNALSTGLPFSRVTLLSCTVLILLSAEHKDCVVNLRLEAQIQWAGDAGGGTILSARSDGFQSSHFVT
eukprot:3773026-Amphidinium_carterae.1